MSRLNWASFKSIVPVAPSVRRAHWDLFSRLGVPENRRNDDEAFYDALLHKIRKDAEFRKDFELRFVSSRKKKDRDKSFVNRSLAWLNREYPALHDYTGRWTSVPANVFEPNTPEAELWGLVLQTLNSFEEEREHRAASAETVWKESRAAFLDTLQHVESPSMEGIGILEDASAVFLEAGAAWKKTAAETERQRSGIRRLLEEAKDREDVAEILEQLGTLDSSRVGRLFERADDARILLEQLRDIGERVAQKTAAFDRLRRDNAPWRHLAPQAAELAAMDEERQASEDSVAEAIRGMKSMIETPEEVVLPETATAAVGRTSTKKMGKREKARPAVLDPEAPAPAAEDAPDIPLPSAWTELSSWCSEHFKGRLSFSSRARNSIKKALYEDVETAARCLWWLAHAYRTSRLDGCGEGVQGPLPGIAGIHNERCGGDAFEFAWSGRRPIADWHVRSGGNSRDPGRCLRIYYCWDDETSMVLVGDMPGHVRSRAS